MTILADTPEVTKATLDEWRRKHAAGPTDPWPLERPSWVRSTEVTMNDDDSFIVTYQGVEHISGDLAARVIATIIVYLDVTDEDVFYSDAQPRVEFNLPKNAPTLDHDEAFHFAAVIRAAATELHQITEVRNVRRQPGAVDDLLDLDG